MTLLFILLGLILLVASGYLALYNLLLRGQSKIKEALLDIDLSLAKRYDTLAKLVDLSAEYTRHERESILQTIRVPEGMNLQDRSALSERMDQVEQAVNQVAESYQELMTNQQFMQLQIAAADCEEQLATAKRGYDASVSAWNDLLVSFPTRLLAAIYRYRPEAYFGAGESATPPVDNAETF